MYLSIKSKSISHFKIHYIKQNRLHNFLMFLLMDIQGHTPTLRHHLQMKNVFNESARSDVIGMTRDVCSLDMCPAKHSKCNEYFWVSGKTYGVKSTGFSLGMSLSKSS